ncbi:MAG: hypothetical protein Q8Q08_04915 [Candidatus Omnitrophota bacterium]|nr:hypothetical protein [Candidatus Omnitrophota bacterium]MDZ4242356.1 hypothetical protein [Candidatus Omnitrophota bacterium]
MPALLKKFLKGLKSILKKIHHAIPPQARKVYMPALSWGLYYVENHINAIFPPVTLYEGLEAGSQTPLSFAYAGEMHRMDTYWDDLVLSDGFKKRLLGRRFFWEIIPELKREYPGCGFLVMEQSFLTIPYFGGKPGFSIPFWFRMEIGIERPMNKLFGRQRSDIERLIRKNKLSFEMTRDRQRFDDFYHNMYVPYIRDRYADDAGINAYELFLKKMPVSEMLFIKKDGKTIAGAMAVFKDGKAFLRKLGVVEANPEYVRSGAIGAIYYFLTQELKTRGYNMMDVGGCRPFLNDGLTRYKLSLGARLSKDNSRHSTVRFLVLGNAAGVRSFLTRNPFLFKNRNKKLCRALFVENSPGLSLPALNDISASSYCEGIAETQLCVCGDKKLPGDPRLLEHQPVSVRFFDELVNG